MEVSTHALQFIIMTAICILSYQLLEYRFQTELFDPAPIPSLEEDLPYDDQPPPFTPEPNGSLTHDVKEDEDINNDNEIRLRTLKKIELKLANSRKTHDFDSQEVAFTPAPPLNLSHSGISVNKSNSHGLLIYNKVAKTASTFVVSLLGELSRRNHFNHIHVPQKHYFNTSRSGELSFLWHHYFMQWPYCSDQHIMFVNAVEDYGLADDERPNWFNIVRQPLQRIVSEFYFQQKMNFSKAVQVMDFDECVESKHCAQLDDEGIFQFTYFCGSSRPCRNGQSLEAVQRAKFNVEAYYSVVGLSHDLKRSFQLLQALLPAFFEGAPKLYEKAKNTYLNSNNYKSPSNATIAKLQGMAAMKNELDFYHFVCQHFELQFRSMVAKKNDTQQ